MVSKNNEKQSKGKKKSIKSWRTPEAQEEKLRKRLFRENEALLNRFLASFMVAQRDSDTQDCLTYEETEVLAGLLLKEYIEEAEDYGGEKILAASMINTLIADGWVRRDTADIRITYKGKERAREIGKNAKA